MSNGTQNNTATRSFRKGLRQLRVMDAPVVKARIMSILGVTTKQSYLRYASGKAANLDIEKARRIEQTFAEYGVTDCWGA